MRSFLIILQTTSSPLRVALCTLASFPFYILCIVSSIVKFFLSRRSFSLILAISSGLTVISICSSLSYWSYIPFGSFLREKSRSLESWWGSSLLSGISCELLMYCVWIAFKRMSSLKASGSCTLKSVVKIYT